MRHSDLVDFESERGEKRRKHRSVGEAFQRSSGSIDAEQDGAISIVRVLKWEKISLLAQTIECALASASRSKFGTVITYHRGTVLPS
jgi:hypothetical protein